MMNIYRLAARLVGATLAASFLLGGVAQAAGSGKNTVTIGLPEAPDTLDPTTGQTYVGRIVLINMCEKLYDMNQNLKLVPELASAMPQITNHGKTYTIRLRQGVEFNDGTAFDAQAVKTTLERDMHDPLSSRSDSLSSIASIDVVNKHTIRLTLSTPFAPLTSILAGRAGMIESPAQLKKLGNRFGQHPVCVGPFRFVSRPSSDRIELKKSLDYYDKSDVHIDHVVFEVITQPNVLTENLRAGDIDIANGIEPSDVASIKHDPHTRIMTAPSLAYQGLSINVSNSNGAGHKPFHPIDTPLASHPKLRAALSLSLNRPVINRVVYDGQYTPACTPIPRASPYYPANFSCPGYNLAKARKLVAESGVPTPIPVTLVIQAGNAQSSKLGQVIQSMAGQAGFKISLRPTEFTTALAAARSGHFDTFLLGWSGRLDPDQNVAPFWMPESTLNYSGADYPDVIRLIDAERESTNPAQRKQLFGQLVQQFLRHNNIIYLFHPKYLIGVRNDLRGVAFYPDQLIRLKNAYVVKH